MFLLVRVKIICKVKGANYRWAGFNCHLRRTGVVGSEHDRPSAIDCGTYRPPYRLDLSLQKEGVKGGGGGGW
jgi:hypothetical protein